MIKEANSRELTYESVAERANVDVSTIEELFDSRSQMVAEAQMVNYFAMVEPLHLVQSRVESAVAEEDQPAFWSAVEENLEMAWSSGQVGSKWGVVNLLRDVWEDPFSQRHFCDLLDIQFERWIEVIEGAQRLGWMDADLDAKALTAIIWSASIGQVIMSGSTVLDLPTQSVKDFYLQVVGAKSQPA
jgi:phytoene/squalene synthetase